MKQNLGGKPSEEQVKSFLDGVSKDYIAELAEPQIDLAELEDSPSVAEVFASHAAGQTKPEKKMSGMMRTVTAVGGIAASLLLVFGIGAMLRETPAKGSGTADLAEESGTTAVTTVPCIALDEDDGQAVITNSPQDEKSGDAEKDGIPETVPALVSGITDNSQQTMKPNESILTTIKTSSAKSGTTKTTTTTGICSDPKRTIVTTKTTGESRKIAGPLTLDIVKQIIAASGSFREMYETILAYQLPSDTYGSGVTLLRFDLNTDAQEYVVICLEMESIDYCIGKEYQTLYQPNRKNDQQADKQLNIGLESYLRDCGYTDAEITKMKSAKIDISTRGPQIAVGFITYYENHQPFNYEKIECLYNSKTTQYLGKQMHSFLSIDPLPQHMTFAEEPSIVESPDASSKVVVHIEDGYEFTDTYPLYKMVFQTTNRDDIQMEWGVNNGQGHVLYLGDLDSDFLWTYDDLKHYYEVVVEHDDSHLGVLGREVISVDYFPQQEIVGKLPMPEYTMRKLCDTLAGRTNGIL